MLYDINSQSNMIPGFMMTNAIAVIESILVRRIQYYNGQIRGALANFLMARLIENHREDSFEMKCLCGKPPRKIRKEFTQFCLKYEKEDKMYEKNMISNYASQHEYVDRGHLSIYSCWCSMQREDPFLYLPLSILSTFIAHTTSYQLGKYDIFTFLHHYMHHRYHQQKEFTSNRSSHTL